MNYLYSHSPMGAWTPQQIMYAVQRATGLTAEQINQKLAEMERARKAAGLFIQVGPFKKLTVGKWHTVEKQVFQQWVANQLGTHTLEKMAQRAGILPVAVVKIPVSKGIPPTSFALYAKWPDPVQGKGRPRIGLFAWQDTDLFKKKKSEYKIPVTKEQKAYFVQRFASTRASFRFGQGAGRQDVSANLIGDHLYVTRKPYVPDKDWHEDLFGTGMSLSDLVVKATFPVVALNDAILKALDEYGFIDAFGELVGAILDVVASVVPAFMPPMAPESQYRKPNYLLWGGIAGGIVLLAAVYKSRKG